MGFPKRNEINKVLKKLEKMDGTLFLSDNATPLKKFRWNICQKFVKYKKEQGISQKELALRLGAMRPRSVKFFAIESKNFQPIDLSRFLCF